jgi:hypothetical protein
MVAIVIFELTQTPPPVPDALRVIWEPTYVAVGPEMVPGVASGFTVTVFVAATEPQILETI